MTVTNLTVDGNSAHGPAANHGGGGIFNNGGDLFVNSSTVSNNDVDGALGNGGGIHVKTGTATIVTSTISGNSSANNAGGIYSDAPLTVNASTIAFNTAVNGATAPSIKNTIVSNNTATTGTDLFSATGVFTSNGYNLIGIDGTNAFTPAGTDIEGSDPLIAALANNGGATLTHAIQTGSPAYDKGDATDSFADQTGAAVFGTSRDIGAYEAQTVLGIDSVTYSNNKRSLVYPNPATKGSVTIALASGYGDNAKGQLYEVGSGKLIKEFNINLSTLDLNLNTISTGVYIVKISSDLYSETHKLVVGR